MRRVILFCVSLAGAALLTACAHLPPAQPDFQLPVKWSGGRADVDAPEYNMSLTLRAEGVAELENVPGGQWTQTDEGICWDDTEALYSGQGTWRAFNARGVEVSFEESTIIVWASPDRFGTYDWQELEMLACGDEYKIWGMHLECGAAGGEALVPCPARQPRRTR